MANEFVKVELGGVNNAGDQRRYTIATGASVSQGALLELLDDRTVQNISGFEKPIAGVAAAEHIANSGTGITVWTNGIFRATSSGAITIGQMLTSGASDNTVSSSAALLTGNEFISTHGNMRALDAVNDATELSVRLLV